MKREFEGEEYTKRIESRIRDEGYTALGIPGRSTALTVSMMLASPKIVSMLLIEYGANVDSVDVMGNDAFMLASVLEDRVNLQFGSRDSRTMIWRQQKSFSCNAFFAATNMGANKKLEVCESTLRKWCTC